MTIRVGDQFKLNRQFSNAGKRLWDNGEVVVVTEAHDHQRPKVKSLWNPSTRHGIVHIEHLDPVKEETVTDPEHLACPSCGVTDHFVEINTSINVSGVSYIELHTGRVEHDGDTEYCATGDLTVIRYECSNCCTEFPADFADPAKRIEEVKASLDALIGDEP